MKTLIILHIVTNIFVICCQFQFIIRADAAEFEIVQFSAPWAGFSSNEQKIVETAIMIKGEISKGDSDKFSRFIESTKNNLDADAPLIEYIALNSPGGEYLEGLKISDLINQHGFKTIVRSEDTCISICAILFLTAHGSTYSRVLQPGATLSFHAPYLKNDVPLAERDESSLQAMTALNLDLSRRASELFRISPTVLSIILRNESDHSVFSINTVERAALIGADIPDVKLPEKYTRTMLENYCSNGLAISEEVLPSTRRSTDQKKIAVGKMRFGTPDSGNADVLLIPFMYSLESDPVSLDTGVYCWVRPLYQLGIFGPISASALSSPEARAAYGELFQSVATDSPMVQGIEAKGYLIAPPDTKLDELQSAIAKMQLRDAPYSPESLPNTGAKPSVTDTVSKFYVCNRNYHATNLRTGPAPSKDRIILRMPNNQTVHFLENTVNPSSGHPWAKIRVGQIEGYVDADFLAQEECESNNARSEAGIATSISVCNARASHSNVRDAPNPKASSVVDQLANGTTVAVVEKTQNPTSGHPWLKIRYGNTVGYIDADLVSESCN